MELVVEVESYSLAGGVGRGEHEEEGECRLCGNPWGKHWIDVACVYVGLGVRVTGTEDLVMQVSMCERCSNINV